MFKKHSNRRGLHKDMRHYWFTIQSPNGQTLATSETYTTAAMRDKGIEAVKRAVWKSSTATDFKEWWGDKVWNTATRISAEQRAKRRPSDTFHLENAKGKIVKR